MGSRPQSLRLPDHTVRGKLDVVPEVVRIDIELIFRVATPNTLNLVLLAQKNARLQLWGNGNVMYQAEP